MAVRQSRVVAVARVFAASCFFFFQIELSQTMSQFLVIVFHVFIYSAKILFFHIFVVNF